MNRLKSLFQKYNVKNRTDLVHAIFNNGFNLRNGKNLKFSTKQKELNAVLKESKNKPRITNQIESYKEQIKENILKTNKLREIKMKKYNASNSKECLEEIKAIKMFESYNKLEVPQGYIDIHNDVTIRVEADQRNNNRNESYAFSIGINQYEHNKMKEMCKRESLKFLNEFLNYKIGISQNKYKHIQGNVSIQKINGFFGGLWDEE